MNESQLSVRHAGTRAELEYSLARYPRALEALMGRRVSPFGDVYVDESERFSRAYRSRVERERLLKVTCRTLEPDHVETVKCVTSALIKVVSRSAFEYRAGWQIDPDCNLQRAHEACGDLVLNLEHFVEILVVAPGPQVRAILCADQLCRDSQAVARPPHAAFEHIGRAEDAADCAQILVLTFELER